MKNGKFNFDELYDRDGTGNVKWDLQYARFGEENVDFGMGVADMDFRGNNKRSTARTNPTQ